MPSWRPVFGDIQRLDVALASVAQIEEFFAERRIVARGVEVSEDTYRVELAVTGRRRRVATCDDSGAIVPGPSLSEVVDSLDVAVRKLQIDIGGVVVTRGADFGEVDVADDDIRLYDAGASGSSELTGVSADVSEELNELSDSDVVDTGDVLEYGAGPMLVVSDIPLADMPGLAAHVKKPLTVLRRGSVTAVLGEPDAGSGEPTSVNVKASFSVIIAADPEGHGAPVVSLKSHGWRLTWAWGNGLTELPWVVDSPEAHEFATHNLGAGALASRIARKIPGADAAKIREVLDGPTEGAAEAIVETMSLPEGVGAAVAGKIAFSEIPGAVVFEPRPLGKRLQTSVAYELVGEGNSKTGLWELYRRAFVDHPVATEVIASLQASAGGVAVVRGIKAKSLGGKIAVIIGGALIANATTRVLTTQWLAAALRTEGLSESSRDDREVPARDTNA